MDIATHTELRYRADICFLRVHLNLSDSGLDRLSSVLKRWDKERRASAGSIDLSIFVAHLVAHLGVEVCILYVARIAVLVAFA